MVWVCPKCGYVNQDDEDEEAEYSTFGSYAFPRCKMCGEPRWYSKRRW